MMKTARARSDSSLRRRLAFEHAQFAHRQFIDLERL
jgi:hypothetical protein